VHPHKYLTLSQGKFASSDGRCRSFGSGGDGYVPGEGVGAVMLKALEDAIRDGDNIHAIVRASAVNHGGKTNGYTVPNPNAQAELILRSLEQAGVELDSIGYIEAHGTGTSLGDPIEIAGLVKAFREYGDRHEPCAIGSVKSNIGHLESAAGIAAVTKAVLQMKHGMFVPSLHAETTNPHIDFDNVPFRVQTRLESWPAWQGRPRRCGVSSFGAGGANAHVVLEEYVAPAVAIDDGMSGLPEAFVLSARDVRSLLRLARRFSGFVASHAELEARDIAYTLQVGRTAMNARLVVPAQNAAEFGDLLKRWIDEANPGDGTQTESVCCEGRVLFGLANDRSSQARFLLEGDSGDAYLQALHDSGDIGKLGRLWTMGVDIDWRRLRHGSAPRRISLPTYVFEKQRYWIPLADTRLPEPPPASGRPAIAAGYADIGVTAGEAVRYVRRWQDETAPQTSQEVQVAPSNVLLFDGGDDIAQVLHRDLRERGARDVVIRFADGFRERAPNAFDLRPDSESDFHALAAELQRRDALPDLVLLAHADASVGAMPSSAPGDAALCALINLCKACIALRHPLRILSIATTDSNLSSLENAALGGFLKSLCREQPKSAARTVSIVGPADDLSVILRRESVGMPTGHVEEVRYGPLRADRTRSRQVGRMVRLEPASSDASSIPLKQGGVYLITGGLGGLGLLIAEHLARHYAARLVLVGRSAPSEASLRRLDGMRAHGATVDCLRGDVSRLDDVRSLVHETRSLHGRIDGVIHAAGTVRDAGLPNKTVEDVRAVLSPKIAGAVHLDLATADEDLDVFVLFASLAGAVGNAGQSDYAYANAFLDAFAERRALMVTHGARRGRTVSIDWPLWQEGGMQLTSAQTDALASRTGLLPMPTDIGIHQFEAALGSDHAHLVVGYGNAAKMASYLSSHRAGEAAAPVVRHLPADSTLLPRTIRYLGEVIGAEIKLDPDAIDPAERIESYGLDSVAITSVNARLERDLGELPKTLLYENETIEKVAAFLVRSVRERLLGLLADSAPEESRIDPSAAAAAPAAAAHAAAHAADSVATVAPTAAIASSSILPNVSAAIPAIVASIAASPVVAEPERMHAPRVSVDDRREARSARIAIIGMDGSHAGLADAEAFWACLRDGRDAIRTIPSDRWDATAHFDPDPAAAAGGKIYCRYGGFMDGIDRFDPRFFKIPHDEAVVMDPQERLFLMSVWHALEDAGYSRDRLKKTHPKGQGIDAGLFVGVTTQSYQMLLHDAMEQGIMATPTAMPWSIANRASYFFDFKGPSLPVDTACSSALVALHMASESLRRGECRIAIAGGVNLYTHRSKYLSLCQRRMLATGDRTRSYGAGDDGFVPGEGIGCFVLKLLDDAIADGDRIHGVIAGSAFDHSGRSNGYSAPNPVAQCDVIERALSAADAHPDSIDCVEGHGTGTALGDSIEVAALSQAFRRRTERKQYCAIGCVKSNIGHSESASGVASLMKVLLQMRHAEFAPTLHCEPANPDIRFEDSPFLLQRTRRPWLRAGDRPRRALINSFGAGGVNACLVIEDFVDGVVETGHPDAADAAPDTFAFVVSAADQEALERQARLHLRFLEENPDLDLARYCTTLQIGRESMPERLAAVVRDRDELVDGLRRWLAAEPDASAMRRGQAVVRRRPRAASVAGAERPAGHHDAAEACIAQWIAGVEPDWSQLHGGRTPRTLSAPNYPFAAERCWVTDGGTAPGQSPRKAGTERLPPLLSYNSSNFGRISFDSWIAADSGSRFDLRFAGHAVLPPSAMLEMACSCGTLAGDARVTSLHDVVWQEPLRLSDDLQLVRTIVQREESGAGFSIVGLNDESGGRTVATGSLGFGKRRSDAAPSPGTLSALGSGCASVELQAHHRRLETRGYAVGTSYRALVELQLGDAHAIGRLELPTAALATADLYFLHPALLDGALQAALALDRGGDAQAAWLPRRIAALRVHRRPGRSCHVLVREAAAPTDDADTRSFDILLLNDESDVLVEIVGLCVTVSRTIASRDRASAEG
jgi:polyketide synthase PksN